MQVLIGILAFILMLSVIVIIHELGHFLAARAFGVHCHEFSIGMGPKLYSRKGKHTIFSIRAVPLGGYVMMAGEEDGSQDLDEESQDDPDNWLKDVPESERLYTKPVWQQIIIMAAGVFMNLVLALVIFIGLNFYSPYAAEPALPVIQTTEAGYPAAEAGLQEGDRIVSITAEDGTILRPQTLQEVSEFLQFNHGESVYAIERDGKTFEVSMAPAYDEENQGYLLGFTAARNVRRLSFWECIGQGFVELWDNVTLIFRTLGQLFQGKGLESVSGPVGIYNVTSQVVSMGLIPYISLFALISVNIGVFNLLPVPALDGGRILILALEKLFRRKMPTKVVEGIIMASFVLLFGLMVFATYNDILRMF